MIISISNEFLTAKICARGAELIELLDSEGVNLLWCGDNKEWGRVSPLLFPIIGRTRNGRIDFRNITYNMPPHGFTRDTEFDIVSQKMDMVQLSFLSSIATRHLYPFDFVFSITYRLTGRTLLMEVQVENTNSETMYFSFGGHTGFSTELDGATLGDYELEFDREIDLVTALVNESKLLTGESKSLGRGRTLRLCKEFFNEDALIFENIKSKSVLIRNTKTGRAIRVDYPSIKNLAIWSQKNCERFVCIEPWDGMPDTILTPTDLDKKPSLIALASRQIYKSDITISV